MKRLIAVCLLLIFFAACTDNTPKDILPKEKMVSLLTDIHVIDGYSMSLPTDSAKILLPPLYASVLSKYGTDSAAFTRSLGYYTKQPRELREMYDQVARNVENLQKSEQKEDAARQKKIEKRRADSLKKAAVKKKTKRQADSAHVKDTTVQRLQKLINKRKRMLQSDGNSSKEIKK